MTNKTKQFLFHSFGGVGFFGIIFLIVVPMLILIQTWIFFITIFSSPEVVVNDTDENIYVQLLLFSVDDPLIAPDNLQKKIVAHEQQVFNLPSDTRRFNGVFYSPQLQEYYCAGSKRELDKSYQQKGFLLYLMSAEIKEMLQIQDGYYWSDVKQVINKEELERLLTSQHDPRESRAFCRDL